MAVLTQWAFCSEETKTLTARATNLERMLRALEATALKADEFFEDNDRLTKALDGLREHTVTLELGGEL